MKIDPVMKVCLISGGAGFIGKGIIDSNLLDHDVILIVDSLSTQVHGYLDNPSFEDSRVVFIRGDIRDHAVWREILEQWSPATIIHLAAETGTGQSLLEPSLHSSTNIDGLCIMLESFSKYSKIPKSIVLASSRAIYGEGAWKRELDDHIWNPKLRKVSDLENQIWDFKGSRVIPMNEKSVPANPVSIYGATKLAQEQILKVWCSSFNVQLTILRLQNVYGPGQSILNSYTGILVFFARELIADQTVPIFEDGLMLRDFVYISDVVSAISTVANQNIDVTSEFLILDVGSGIASTVLDVANTLKDLTHRGEVVITGQFRIGDVRHAFADIENTREILGWEPKVSLEEGLGQLIDWIHGLR
jgi:dTDP-L-rhamnose 4-epimerase